MPSSWIFLCFLWADWCFFLPLELYSWLELILDTELLLLVFLALLLRMGSTGVGLLDIWKLDWGIKVLYELSCPTLIWSICRMLFLNRKVWDWFMFLVLVCLLLLPEELWREDWRNRSYYFLSLLWFIELMFVKGLFLVREEYWAFTFSDRPKESTVEFCWRLNC